MNKVQEWILKELYKNREAKVPWPNDNGEYTKGIPLIIFVIITYPIIWPESKDLKNLEKLRDEILLLKKKGYITTLAYTSFDVLDYAKHFYEEKGDSIANDWKDHMLRILKNDTADIKRFFQGQNAAKITDEGIEYFKKEFPVLSNN